MSDTATTLITGFPAYLSQRMARAAVAAGPAARVLLLCQDDATAAATAFLDTLPESHRERVQVVLGEVGAMDLGMSGVDYRQVTAETTIIHHITGADALSADAGTLRRLHLHGAHNLIELATACTRLRRMCHFSSAQVAGKRTGVVLEEELDEGQSFRNIYEEIQCAAEKRIRAAMARLPITVLRPSVIVGDSQTGEIDRFDGPYYLMSLIMRNATQVNLPLPGRGTAPLHLVPIDYVIAAAEALSHDGRAAGGTFHLVDPNPLSARRVYELVAEHAHTAQPRGSIPTGLARTLMRAPGIERLARAPRAFMDAFDHQVFYNSRRAHERLAPAGVFCPPFDSYVGPLLRYLEAHIGKRKRSQSSAEHVIPSPDALATGGANAERDPGASTPPPRSPPPAHGDALDDPFD
ncbi:MAG: SDR family oxidoreductase [Haliangiales bacterium]